MFAPTNETPGRGHMTGNVLKALQLGSVRSSDPHRTGQSPTTACLKQTDVWLADLSTDPCVNSTDYRQIIDQAPIGGRPGRPGRVCVCVCVCVGRRDGSWLQWRQNKEDQIGFPPGMIHLKLARIVSNTIENCSLRLNSIYN